MSGRQLAGLAVLEAIARQQECRRCGQPPSAHWHYRDNPSANRACPRWRPRLRFLRIPDTPAGLVPADREEIR